MKARLPRKVKKAMSTKERLADKKIGYKMKKSAFKLYMHLKYLRKLLDIKEYLIKFPEHKCSSIHAL